MRNFVIELTDDSIGSRRFAMLRGINNAHVNFQWEIGKYFIDQKKEKDEEFIVEESGRLAGKWGSIFNIENIKASISFATLIPDEIHVGVLGSVISWKYLKVLLPLNDAELLLSFTKLCIDENLDFKVLQESVNQIIESGDVPDLPKIKRKKTKIDYLYSSETIEHGKKGETSFKSHEILVLSGKGQLLPDGIINNLFPDKDLELFLKVDLSGGSLFDDK